MNIDENKKTKKYPSQIKYEQNNPMINARMKLDEYEKINDMAKKVGKTKSFLIRTALLNLEKDFSAAIAKAKEDWKKEGERIGNQNGYNQWYYEGKKEGENIGYQNGYNQGYKKGQGEWQICCYCLKCKKLIPVDPNSAAHNIIIEKTKDSFICADCKKNQIYSISNF